MLYCLLEVLLVCVLIFKYVRLNCLCLITRLLWLFFIPKVLLSRVLFALLFLSILMTFAMVEIYQCIPIFLLPRFSMNNSKISPLILSRVGNDSDFDNLQDLRHFPASDFQSQFGMYHLSLVFIGDCYTVRYDGPKNFISQLAFVPTSSDSTYFLGSAGFNLSEISRLITFWFYLYRRILHSVYYKQLYPTFLTVGNPNHYPLHLSLNMYRYRYQVSHKGFYLPDENPDFLINSTRVMSRSKSLSVAFDSYRKLVDDFGIKYGLL